LDNLKEAIKYCGPMLFNGLLVGWTLLVSPYTAYGDNWAINPVLILALLILVWHISLIVIERGLRIIMSLYMATHLLISYYIWFWALWKISKDSL